MRRRHLPRLFASASRNRRMPVFRPRRSFARLWKLPPPKPILPSTGARLRLSPVCSSSPALALFFFLRTPRGEGEINSIAVLPLDIKSTDPDAEYISDGITESVNNSLAGLPGLKVVPHSAALRYKGKSAEIQKVGAALGVQVVLTGRIVQRGEDLTVAVELDDIGKGKQLWGDRYNRKVADLLAIQSEIAREVSQQLRGHLSTEDQRKLARGSTENSEAYQLYLKGKYHTSKFTKDEFRKGIDYFNQALAKDPNYGLAYSGLAYYYILQDDWYLAPNESASRANPSSSRGRRFLLF